MADSPPDMNYRLILQMIAASLMIIMGLFCIVWGPGYFRRTIKLGQFSPDEGQDKITRVKIYGGAFIICGIGLYSCAIW
jgi:hypothetical protein